jgi:3-dehydroquinate synthetase
VISDDFVSLAGALSFDRSLSRCVQQEVEDHLREAVAADPSGDRLEAERRAIANFGDPHVTARADERLAQLAVLRHGDCDSD